ncbi:hypothetical protein OLMES_5218 [Oleiphilus messinensis]|uniref:Uncharacterized protein n=1 Tax=Oleiphilus messinensis TaxID=141451 RepID=A0A1Y0IF91_9GAMM|nr:hypothetical protein OLMES_5218 [Oleiphilus messinensis]
MISFKHLFWSNSDWNAFGGYCRGIVTPKGSRDIAGGFNHRHRMISIAIAPSGLGVVVYEPVVETTGYMMIPLRGRFVHGSDLSVFHPLLAV